MLDILRHYWRPTGRFLENDGCRLRSNEFVNFGNIIPVYHVIEGQPDLPSVVCSVVLSMILVKPN
jgi:hypothetical protein